MNRILKLFIVFGGVLLCINVCSCLQFRELTIEDGFEKTSVVNQSKTQIADLGYESAGQNRKSYTIYDRYSIDFSNWYTCRQNFMDFKEDKNGIRLSFREAKNDCAGLYFSPLDIRTHKYLKIRAGFAHKNPEEMYDVSYRLVDSVGGITAIFSSPSYFSLDGKMDNYYFPIEALLKKTPGSTCRIHQSSFAGY